MNDKINPTEPNTMINVQFLAKGFNPVISRADLAPKDKPRGNVQDIGFGVFDDDQFNRPPSCIEMFSDKTKAKALVAFLKISTTVEDGGFIDFKEFVYKSVDDITHKEAMEKAKQKARDNAEQIDSIFIQNQYSFPLKEIVKFVDSPSIAKEFNTLTGRDLNKSIDDIAEYFPQFKKAVPLAA